MSSETETGLTRAIGPWTLGANAVNLSLGAGIFALPAVVAGILGPAAILAYLICGVAIGLVLLCFVEIGSATSRSGGAVAYIEDAFGPLAGFVAWVVYTLVFCCASCAAIALVFVDALVPTIPELSGGVPRVAALLALFGGLAAVNILGVRQGARVAVATTAVKLAPLVVLVCAGTCALRLENLQWTTWPTASKLGEASLVLFFAFSGAEAALTPSGEIMDPRRTVPRGILIGTATLIAIYVGVQVVSQGVLGAGLPLRSEATLAAVAERIFGPAGWRVMIACTALATFGTLAGDMLASPRGFLPVAAAGLLPVGVGRVHPRFRTPHIAIGLYAGVGFAMALSGAFKPLAILSSGSILLVYFAVCLAAIRLRTRRPRSAGAGGFRVPGGWTVPLAGVAIVAWLLAHISATEAASLGATVLMAALYYAVRTRVLATRSTS